VAPVAGAVRTDTDGGPAYLCKARILHEAPCALLSATSASRPNGRTGAFAAGALLAARWLCDVGPRQSCCRRACEFAQDRASGSLLARLVGDSEPPTSGATGARSCSRWPPREMNAGDSLPNRSSELSQLRTPGPVLGFEPAPLGDHRLPRHSWQVALLGPFSLSRQSPIRPSGVASCVQRRFALSSVLELDWKWFGPSGGRARRGAR
jgi:hypothetical protein